jgi:hypothetical protein
MGPAYSKVKCMCLPVQSGKTRRITELIRDELSDGFTDSSNVVNIIISSNNQLLVKQTESRMQHDLGEDDPVIEGGVFGWISNSAKKSKVSVQELAWKIFTNEISMVVVCANRPRLNYLCDLFHEMSKLKTKQVNIWIDEADTTMNLWNRYPEIHNNDLVQQITLISATWDSVFRRYGTLCVMGFESTCPECYRGLRDSHKHIETETERASSFVHSVIHKYPHLKLPGMKAFIPGDRTTASHDAIADMLHSDYGFVVVVYNGYRKEVLVPGKPSIDLNLKIPENGPPPQFAEELAKLYYEQGWQNYPFAITGMTCISRGVTMQSVPSEVCDGFVFDYGIIPPIASKPEAYQTMGRLFGNIGESPSYKPIAIYSTKSMFAKVEKQESIAINLARMVHESGNDCVGPRELKSAQNATWDVQVAGEKSKPHLTDSQLFRVYSDASVVKQVLTLIGARTRFSPPNDRGFIEASLLKKKEVLQVLDVIRRVPTLIASGGGKHGEKISRSVVPCYKDISDSSTLVFVVLLPPDKVTEEIRQSIDKYESIPETESF